MARKLILLISSGLMCTLGLLSGCSNKEEPKKPQQEAVPAKDAVVRKQTEILVPSSVKGKWKSVKISIIDKEKKQEGYVVVEVGKTMKVNGTDLVIEVENFLPHFIMDGTTLTSSTNSPKNPAVQLHVTENGLDVFKGWLFTLYPNTHASKHPRYGFGLVDFTPAK
jgi:hydrogenase maturation factor